MKKYMTFGAVLILSGSILMACSDDDNNNNNNVDNNGNTEENSPQINDQGTDDNNNDAQNENNNTTDNDNTDEEDDSSSPGAFDPGEEDQEGLGIGDTGTFGTSLGSYEMTLDSAESIGEELDGEPSDLGQLVVLDITIKNTSDEVLQIEDLMESMRLGDTDEVSGDPDSAEYFDSIEEFTGELGPGDEQSGQFIGDVYESDTYYFMKDSGNISGGSSNQVIWEFEAEEE